MSISPENISLTPDQQQLVARLAEQSGRPWNEVLQQALAPLEQTAPVKDGGKETVYEAMTRLGLLGCITDAPADLSTNPVYMEGFGERDR